MVTTAANTLNTPGNSVKKKATRTIIKHSVFVPVLFLLLAFNSSFAFAELENSAPPSKETQPAALDLTEFPEATNTEITAPDKESTKLAAAIGAPSGISGNTNSKNVLNTIPEDENSLRLLEVRIGSYKLEDLINAYLKDDIVFIPLGYFSELIDVAINADPQTGIAQGFFLREDRTFHLDAKRGEIVIAGKLKRFNRQQVALHEFDDIYVDSNLLGEWLPLKLDIDLYGSRLKVISEELLPLEQRKKREQRMAMVRSRLPQDRGFPRQEFPYQEWSHPLINQTARIGIQRDADGELDGTFGYTTFATADLLNMESTWYLAGNDEDIAEDFRVTLSKHDPNATLLGAAQATEYAVGHINEPRLELITRPLDPQIGVLISNYPLTRQLQYDSHNFRGDLLPGWEVELYRNNDLLSYINNSENGQYQFDDVPLLFGTNYFRLVFYGPQGQIREETYNFTLDHSLTQPGKHHYRVIASDDDDFSNRIITQYDYGLNKNISFAASASSIPMDDNLLVNEPEKKHNYLSGGIRGFYNSLFYKSDLVVDMQSGSAIDWEVQTRLGSFIINLGETYFKDAFISEEFPETFLTIDRRSELKLDTAIPASFLPRIPISFEMERKKYQDGTTITRYGNRISMQQHGLSMSNTLNRNQQTGLPTITNGNFQISRRAFGYNLRGSLSYQVSPDSELSATTFIVDGIKIQNYHINSGVSHLNQSNTNEIFFNMTKTKGQYSLGLNTRYRTGGLVSVDLTFNIGLGREPRSGEWKPEYRPIASQGAMSVQTFVDNNLNGRKDPGEKGISGTKVQINGGNVNEPADENGVIFVTGVEPYRDIDVGLALETLDDPLWQPAIKGRRISLRPGYIAQLNFPVIITGEVDGTAYVKFGKEQREVSGVIVELLDLDGKVVQSAKTAYDGFYLMDKIPVGKYQLRVSREQTDSLNLLPVQPTFVIIEPDKPIVNGMDFILQRRAN